MVSTIDQQATRADQDTEQDMSAAVEAQMGKIISELGGALGVLLTSLGTRSGLWAALAGRRAADHRGSGREGAGRPGAGT